MSWRKTAFAVLVFGAGLLCGIVFLPKMQSAGDQQNVAVAGTCTEHGVPADVCTRCHPELIPEFQESGDWCAGHEVPETQCVLCHPELADEGVLPPAWIVEESRGHDHSEPDGHDHGEQNHDAHEGQEPIPVQEVELPNASLADSRYPGLSTIYRSNQPGCPTDQSIIQFASHETAERSGLTVQPLVVAPAADRFEAPAEVVFNQDATTTLTSTLPVSITRWLREPGVPVKTGEAIALVESPDMALLQGEYLEAYADWQIHDRELQRAEELIARRLIDSASYERITAKALAAEARLIQHRSRLQLAGLADVDLAELRETREIRSRFELRATRSGVLLERIAPLGRVLDPGTDLAVLGEPDALWIEARVREDDLSRVAMGQHVEFTADGKALRRVHGTVIWISHFLDPHSRTATARVEPEMQPGVLRAHEFGQLNIAEESAPPALLVPQDAVQWEGCCNVVFVREAADRFRPCKVNVAGGPTGYYRVMAGLQPDEHVVVQGSFLLKTELKKSSIGAGCCGLEASS